MNERKIACITIDVEADFTSVPTPDRYYGLFDDDVEFSRFVNLCEHFEIDLTCFVVGQTADDRPDHIQQLLALGAEFGSHSLTHDLSAQTSEREVRGGIEHFEDFFGRTPPGYRSPRGKLSNSVIEILESTGVGYDSSVIASFRPGVYSNLRMPLSPFRWSGLSLLELPISVLPFSRLPMALSYIKVFGKGVFDLSLRRASHGDPLVILLHPMDLVYSDSAFEHLSLPWKIAYSRNRGKSWEVFEWLLQTLRESGYRFTYMSELYQQALSSQLAEVAPDFGEATA